jgi:phytoene synthase
VSLSTSEAYTRCEAITREQAANFYYGIRLLAPARRRAMCAAYAFARRIDDIGDGELARERKLALLDESAAQLSELERGGAGAAESNDPVIVALADAHVRFSLPAGALGELIEGVRMDVNGVRYESVEELVLYCRCVAGAIGRVCLAIFGVPEGHAGGDRDAQSSGLADDLGVALQLTNILRDVREDAENGRVYLPAEDLRRFGLLPDRPALGVPEEGRVAEGSGAPGGGGAPEEGGASELLATLGRAAGEPPSSETNVALRALVDFEARRAHEWFERGLGLVSRLDRRSAACVLAMAGIYHRLLERIEAEPARALSERLSLSRGEKVRVALRSMAGGRA